MKYSIFLILTLSILFSSCSEEWLTDVEPQGKTLETNFYKTPEEMEQAMVAVYNSLKNQYWQGVWASWYIYSSVASDDATVHGGGRTDRPEFWDVYDFTVNSETAGLAQVFNRNYYGINRANVVLDRVTGESVEAKQAIAEAKMLRAMFYFDLVRYFGNVPLVLKQLTPSEYSQPKVDKTVILNQIVSDLTDAAADLPVTRKTGSKYRVTKYAAHGLLGKVYTYMASPYYNMGSDNYNKAAVELEKVINEGPFTLLPNYDDIWYYGNEFNNETMIEYSYGKSDEFDRWGNGSDATGNVVQQLQGPRGISGGNNDTLRAGWGFDMVSRDLVQAYRTQGDSVRLHATALGAWQYTQWGYTIGDQNEDWTGYYSKKRMTWKGLNVTGAVWAWGNNERILRLGDIYLLYAECLANTGRDAEAIAAANVIRSRAGLGSIEAVMSSQGLTLLEAIKLERRLELGMEGNRFFDLVRWDDAKDNQILLARPGFTPEKRHWPLPQIEIDATNGILTQNAPY